MLMQDHIKERYVCAVIMNSPQLSSLQGKGKGKGKGTKGVATASNNNEPAAVRKLRSLDVFAGCGGSTR